MFDNSTCNHNEFFLNETFNYYCNYYYPQEIDFFKVFQEPTQEMLLTSSYCPIGNSMTPLSPISPITPTHKQIKPFSCHICSRSFARKHDLQRHIRVHTGAKPYSCLNCNKAFARTDALKRHLRMEDACRSSPIIQAMKNTGIRRYRNL